ncbi:MAG: LCP family protein [Mycobacteriaceae bacterium]|nr:LCP family protein [Mycobacteriaceae bacterium]
MTRPARRSSDTEVLPRVRAPRHALPPRDDRPGHRGGRWVLAGARVLIGLTAVVALVATGMGWASYRNITGGITTSQALVGGPASTGGEQNILIMGLDSRLDQQGRPLPQDIYDALHAGDETAGGYNANVLIVLHIPGGDGPITAISIPRDDYVELAGCPTSECKGKIKQAYGLAYQHALDTAAGTTQKRSHSTATDAPDPVVQEQMGREAGRKAQIDTVRRLLGIPIDHFIELTLVAFFQIAQVVQPITVCLNADTADPFSGADFHQGVQQIDAAQAMAFVRQRRDVNDELFTDMDRTRRQQAFIASLVSALRHGGALSSPAALRHLLDVARQNVAVDAGFDLASFVQHASGFTDRTLSLYTLPITEFGKNPDGEDVNFIDVPTIRAIAHTLTTGGSPTSTAPSSNKPAVPAVLNVVNATRHNGLATSLVDTFASRGFAPGVATTADTLADSSSIDYGPGAHDAAQTLADQFGLTATESDSINPNTVQLLVGGDFPSDDYLTDTTTATSARTSTTPTTPVTTVAATATGTAAPVPTALSRMSATDTPCVK